MTNETGVTWFVKSESRDVPVSSLHMWTLMVGWLVGV